MNHPDDLYEEAQRPTRAARRLRWLLVVLALVLVASGTAFAFTGPLAPADDDNSSSARPAGTASPGVTTTPGTGGAPAPTCRQPLRADDPLRLWIGGDSLAGSLGPSLGAMTGKTGVVQPTFHSKVSSGLASADFYDWTVHAPEDLLKYNPEVAVFIIGTNDAKALPQSAGNDPEWRQRYTDLVEEMLGILIGNGRTVYWVGAPVVKDRSFSERVQVVNKIFQDVVALHPTAHYVDAYDALADSDGKYSNTLPDKDGDPVVVRAGDGVHLTPDGGDRLAKAVFDQLDPACKVSDQADPDEAKDTVEVKGSSQPGTRRTTPATTEPDPSATTAPSTVPTTVPITTTVPPTSIPPSTTTRPGVPPSTRQ